jgi:hypothetical protein
MDTQRIIPISLNFQTPQTVSMPEIQQYDTVIFEFNVFDGESAADLSTIDRISLNYQRPDGVTVTKLLTASANSISYEMGKEEMDVPGIGKLNIQLFSGNTRISSSTLKVYVFSVPGADFEGVEGMPLLQELFNEVAVLDAETQASATYALNQGDHAKLQAEKAGLAADTAQTNWLPPVADYTAVEAIASPSLGDTVQTNDNGYVYRFNGTEWVNTQQYGATALANVNVQLAEKAKREELGSISLEEFPIIVPEADDTERIKRLLANVAGRFNKIIFPKSTYQVSGNSIVVGLSDIIFEGNGSTIIKTSGMGYVFDFGGSLIQKNIKLKDFFLEGNNQDTANGGLGFATNKTTSQINGLQLENIVCRKFAQYGVNIGSVSDIDIRNVRVEEHGSVNVNATIGVGFIIYPKNLQSRCRINGLYSEINPNATITSAAFKYQVIKDGLVNNVHAINGTEEVVSLEATDNTIYSNITVENRDVATLGLIISSNNNTYGILNASYQMENVRFVGAFTSAMSLSAFGVSNCDFSNFNFRKATAGQRVVIATNGSVDNCRFFNFSKAQIRLDIYSGTTCSNSSFENVNGTGGAFTLTGNNNSVKYSKFDTGGFIKFTGSDNIIVGMENQNSNSHSFILNGDRNKMYNCISVNPPDASRAVWVQSGDGNQVINLVYEGVLGVLNNGTNTKEIGTTVVA